MFQMVLLLCHTLTLIALCCFICTATFSHMLRVSVHLQIQLNLSLTLKHTKTASCALYCDMYTTIFFLLLLFQYMYKYTIGNGRVKEPIQHTNDSLGSRTYWNHREPFFNNSCERNAIHTHTYLCAFTLSLYRVYGLKAFELGIMQMDWGLENRMWCFC